MTWFVQTAWAQSSATPSIGGGAFSFIGMLLGVVVIIFGLVFFIKKFANRQKFSNDPTLQRVTLLITVPKEFSEAEEQAFGQSQDPTKRAISVAESLFSFLGGIKAQRWYQSVALGRTDHFR